MNELFKRVIQFLGIMFAALVIGFTGYQTYFLLAEVSGSPLIAWLGLALFEGGMLYWWFVFQKEAEGIRQLALSLLLFVFGLALVAGSTGLHLGAIDAAALGANTPAKLVTIAAIINLIGKTLYPIFSPETFGRIWERALEGVVMAKAYAAAQGKADDMAEQLADSVGGELVRRLTVSVLTNHHLRHEAEKHPPALPLLNTRNTIEAINLDDDREIVAADGSPALTTRPRGDDYFTELEQHNTGYHVIPVRRDGSFDIFPRVAHRAVYKTMREIHSDWNIHQRGSDYQDVIIVYASTGIPVGENRVLGIKYGWNPLEHGYTSVADGSPAPVTRPRDYADTQTAPPPARPVGNGVEKDSPLSPTGTRPE